MLGEIVVALKSIIDLLLKRDENKKVRVETKIREQELADRTTRIERATLEDVKKYDPNYKKLREKLVLKSEREYLKNSDVHREVDRKTGPVKIIISIIVIIIITIIIIIFLAKFLDSVL
jgi:hypothetical protein